MRKPEIIEALLANACAAGAGADEVALPMRFIADRMAQIEDLRRRYNLFAIEDVLNVAIAALNAIAVGDGRGVTFYVQHRGDILKCRLPLKRPGDDIGRREK